MPGATDAASLSLERDGAQLWPAAASTPMAELLEALADVPADQPGLRLAGNAGLRRLLASDGAIGRRAADMLGERCRAVRAVLFDKSAATNWSLDWHQDRTIVVRRRVAVPGFGPWTTKAGLQHVAPPFELLARMITVRIHIDDVDEDNAPLLIAPGSHLLGRIPVEEIAAVVRCCGTAMCLARAGDIWCYNTPVLHASSAAAVPRRRRVLQVDFAAQDLPGGLEWQGV